MGPLALCLLGIRGMSHLQIGLLGHGTCWWEPLLVMGMQRYLEFCRATCRFSEIIIHSERRKALHAHLSRKSPQAMMVTSSGSPMGRSISGLNTPELPTSTHFLSPAWRRLEMMREWPTIPGIDMHCHTVDSRYSGSLKHGGHLDISAIWFGTDC